MADILAVDLPDVNTPDAKDGVGWADTAVDWVTGLSADAWKLIVIGVVAALIVWAFRRSVLLKGIAVGVVIMAIAAAIWL